MYFFVKKIIVCVTAEMKEAFMLFDYSKSGTISNQDIGSLIRSVGLKPSQAEVNEIVNEVGGSGQLERGYKMRLF